MAALQAPPFKAPARVPPLTLYIPDTVHHANLLLDSSGLGLDFLAAEISMAAGRMHEINIKFPATEVKIIGEQPTDTVMDLCHRRAVDRQGSLPGSLNIFDEEVEQYIKDHPTCHANGIRAFVKWMVGTQPTRLPVKT